MAEALINHYLSDSWEAFSAGTRPSAVNRRATLVLQEIGVETAGLRSKSVDEFLARDDLDLVITVCDHARESCPLFATPVPKKHFSFPDPAPFTDAPDEEALAVFREVREAIREWVVGGLEGNQPSVIPVKTGNQISGTTETA